MVFARWGSNTVRRYIKDAPLANLTTMYKVKMAGGVADPVSKIARTQTSGGVSEERLVDWASKIKVLIEEVN